MTVLGIISFCFFLSCLVWAAVTDVQKMRISNRLCLVLLVGFVVLSVLSLFNISAFPVIQQHVFVHYTVFAAVLVVTAGLFFARLFGGGDAKYLPVVALWVGASGLPIFLLVMGVCGGLLAVLAVLLPKLNGFKQAVFVPDTWLFQLQQGERGVPYGVAISAGGLTSMLLRMMEGLHV